MKGLLMSSDPKLVDLLGQLKTATSASKLSIDSMTSAMERLLLWLNRPENNTDKNCREIDNFISFEIMPEKRFEELPEDIKGILFDMGATLHDTHTSPEIAENFESTPAHLLARVQNLYPRIKDSDAREE
jgi:hypothetical protein